MFFFFDSAFKFIPLLSDRFLMRNWHSYWGCYDQTFFLLLLSRYPLSLASDRWTMMWLSVTVWVYPTWTFLRFLYMEVCVLSQLWEGLAIVVVLVLRIRCKASLSRCFTTELHTQLVLFFQTFFFFLPFFHYLVLIFMCMLVWLMSYKPLRFCSFFILPIFQTA